MYFSNLQLAVIGMGFVLVVIVVFRVGQALAASRRDKLWHQHMGKIRKDIAKSSRSIIRGQVSEQLAPYLPDFPFDPASCKFLGSPVDFVVFHKLDDPENQALVFVEVKTGQARLNHNERMVREAIKRGSVYYYEYRFNGADETPEGDQDKGKSQKNR